MVLMIAYKAYTCVWLILARILFFYLDMSLDIMLGRVCEAESILAEI